MNPCVMYHLSRVWRIALLVILLGPLLIPSALRANESLIASVSPAEEKRPDSESVGRRYPLTVWAGPRVSVPLAFISPIYTFGYGGVTAFSVDRLSRLFISDSRLEKLRLGAEIGAMLYQSRFAGYDTLTQFPLQVQLGYRLEIFPRITLLPTLGAGLTIGRFANVNAARTFTLFATIAGVGVEYPLNKDIWLMTATAWYAEYDSVVNSFWKTTVMAGYRW